MSRCVIFFFFKQKTAYEMRISDWSSDVCSSDLHRVGKQAGDGGLARARRTPEDDRGEAAGGDHAADRPLRDRKSVVKGKSVTVRVDLGGRRIIKKKQTKQCDQHIQ